MVQKEMRYYDTCFPARAVEEAHNRFRKLAGVARKKPKFQHLVVGVGHESWGFDDRAEYLAAYPGSGFSMLDEIVSPDSRFDFVTEGRSATLRVRLPERAAIEDVFVALERHLEAAKLVTSQEVTIFIGHGRDGQWYELAGHLRDQHGFRVVAYEFGPRAGMSVKEVLEEMLDSAAFALLVLTGEDLHADGELHARDNVIHELGLFQGRLGFTRAIALLEEGVVEFSNILGINQIRFPKDGIRAAYGDVLATVRREFG